MGAKKAKREPGRPPMPAGESKGTTITLRMRPEDAEEIRAAAEADGLSLSAWARRALLRAASK